MPKLLPTGKKAPMASERQQMLPEQELLGLKEARAASQREAKYRWNKPSLTLLWLGKGGDGTG